MFRKILAAGLLVVTAVSMAGCTTYTREQATQVPNSVVEITYEIFGDGDFAYVDGSGDLIPLPVCGLESIFSQYYCETEDGVYVFAYSRSKTGLVYASLTVDGVEYPLTCALDADRLADSIHICLPTEEE